VRNRLLLLASSIALACACTTTLAADPPKPKAAVAQKARKEAPGIVFHSLWTADRPTGMARAGGGHNPLTYAICPGNCTVTVTVVLEDGKCRLEIDPLVMVVASASDLTWTIVGSADYGFTNAYDVKFPQGPPKGWKNKKQDATSIVGADANSAKNAHLYDVTVHLKTDPNKGCHTDPIIVNTG
jgi:hypothetical protein